MKKEWYKRKIIFKKNIGFHTGRSDHGLTHRVDQVLSGYCTSLSFILLRPVQLSG
jgi:hypothetical protein